MTCATHHDVSSVSDSVGGISEWNTFASAFPGGNTFFAATAKLASAGPVRAVAEVCVGNLDGGCFCQVDDVANMQRC